MTKPSECVLNCSSEELIRTDAAKHNSQFKEDTCYCVNTNRDEGEESKTKTWGHAVKTKTVTVRGMVSVKKKID